MSRTGTILLILIVNLNAPAQNPDHILFDLDLRSPVTSLRVSHDGQQLLAGDQDGVLHVLSTADFSKTQEIEASQGEGILDIEITPGQDVLFLAAGKVIKLLDDEGNPLTNWNQHNTTIWSMDLDPSGKRLVSAEMNRTFQLWDIYNGKVIESLRAHEEPTLAVAFGPNGKYFASGSNDKQVFLWDAASLEVISSFHGLSDHIYDVEFSPDGKRIAACSKDGSFRIWNVADRKLVRVFKGHRDMVMEIEFNPDGQYILSASADFTIKLWDVNTGDQIFSYVENDAAVLDIVFLPGGKTFASACMDNHLKVRELHPEIFVLKYYGDEYREEMKDDPLFLPRQKNEKRSEYEERVRKADTRKAELIAAYYSKYLLER